MSIYNDVLDIEEMINDSFDPETGEILEEDVQAGEELKQEIIAVGLEKLCKVRANMRMDIDGLKAEKKRIDDMIKSKTRKLERFENYILLIHKMSGEKKSIAGSFTVSTRKSTSVQVSDDFNNENYQIIEEVKKIDKMAIKKDLAAGVEIAGAILIENENLQVK